MSRLKEKLTKKVKNGAHSIVWAFDPIYDIDNSFNDFKRILKDIHDLIAGIKFNRQLILPYGLKNEKLIEIINLCKTYDLPIIMDAKVNDIGYTNESIAKMYFRTGFDGLIINPFVGDAGISPIMKVCNALNRDAIFLTYMSHSTADFGYGRKVETTQEELKKFNRKQMYLYELFASKINEWDACGAIVGGTVPNKIIEVRKILKLDKLIFSPGIGAQGGSFGQSMKSGMSYAIIGRSITNSKDPNKTILDLIND